MFKKKQKKEKKVKNKKGKKIEKEEIFEKNEDDDLRFNADNEIIIGLRRIPDEPQKPEKRTRHKKRKKKKKTKNKEMKRTKLAKKIAMIIMILIIIITAIIIALYSPIFNVTDIKVKGNKIISKEKIISISKIQLNANTYKMKKEKIINNIKQNSYVENVQIKRILPNVIEIDIEERVPSFAIQLGEGFAYINNQGYILEISSEKINKPIIEGISTKEQDITEGRRLRNEDLEKLEEVLKIIECCNSNDLGQIISSINIKEKQNYKIGFETQGKVAYIGDISNLTTKILYVKAIMEKEKENEGEIFVNVDLNKQNVFFRENV